jgi:hypothetical protein
MYTIRSSYQTLRCLSISFSKPVNSHRIVSENIFKYKVIIRTAKLGPKYDVKFESVYKYPFSQSGVNTTVKGEQTFLLIPSKQMNVWLL